MARLWSNESVTPEGKYPIVLRRDGTVFDKPYFLVAWSDPCAPAAYSAYADEAERLGMDPAFIADVRWMAVEAEDWRKGHPEHEGDPDAPRHRKDDPVTLAWARSVRSRGV